MSTLATCIKRAGKALNPADAEEVRTLRANYIEDGMDGQAASQAAIDDVLSMLSDEREVLAKQVVKQGGRMPDQYRVYPALPTQGDKAEAEVSRLLFSKPTPEQDEVLKSMPLSGLAKAIRADDVVEEVRHKSKRMIHTVTTDAMYRKHFDKVAAMVPTRFLKDFARDEMVAPMDRLSNLFVEVDAMANSIRETFAERMEKVVAFVGKHDEARATQDLIHDSTLAGVDPSVGYKPVTFVGKTTKHVNVAVPISVARARKALKEAIAFNVRKQRRTGRQGGNVEAMAEGAELRDELAALEAKVKQEKARSEAKDELSQRWQSLSPDAQEIYTTVRDMYKDVRAIEDKAFEQRMDDLAAGKNPAEVKAIDSVRMAYSEQKLDEPYFRLYRTGDFWVAAYANEERKQVLGYWRFSSLADYDAKLDELEAAGVVTSSGKRRDDATPQAIDPTFAAEVVDKIRKMGGGAAKQLADQVWQQHLERLPDLSLRKTQMHRRKRAGFEQDITMGLAHTVYHGASQIAKLSFSGAMDRGLNELQEAAKEGSKTRKGAEVAPVLHEEMVKRVDMFRTHTTSTLANKATQLGFFMYLGLTPAAAIVNMSQTAILGLPIMAAKFGWAKSMRALLRASAQAFRPAGIKDQLTGDEKLAFEAFHARGLMEKTGAHSMAGVATEGAEYTGTQSRIMQVVSYPFHRAEVWNREATAMAAYRLARTKVDHDSAMKMASDLTWDAHFDYGTANRPRIMQRDFPKVVFLFKQYSLNMSYRLMRDANDAMRGLSQQDRKEARTRLAGVLGMTGIFAGAAGMPLYSMISAMAGILLGDEDEPFDMDTELRVALSRLLGATGSQVVMDGPTNVLTGLDVGSRVSLNNLWLRDPTYALEGKDLWHHYASEAMGPVFKLGDSTFEGLSRISQGTTERGVEMLMPKAGRDAMKALRFLNEGVLNLQGEDILPREDVSMWNALSQGIGFTPAKLALQYKQNTAIKGAEVKINQRRQLLLNRRALATMAKDGAEIKTIDKAIMRYNKAHPQYAITRATLKQSLKRRAKLAQESRGGVNLNKRLAYLYDELQFLD